MDNNERAKAAQLFSNYVSMSEQERAKIIDTGMFNSFINAYMTATLYAMEMPIEKINQAQEFLSSILDETDALKALEIAKDITDRK